MHVKGLEKLYVHKNNEWQNIFKGINHPHVTRRKRDAISDKTLKTFYIRVNRRHE